MNKDEQDFCSWLGAHLKSTNHRQSMLIECKVAKSDFFHIKEIRKSQVGTLNRLEHGMPIVHKISDGGVGSKLVDMIYISAYNTKLKPFVAIKFKRSGNSYLVPWAFMAANLEYQKIAEQWFSKYKIKWNFGHINKKP